MTIRLGIIGMGYCGCQHYRAAASVPGLEVAAVADVAPVRGIELPSTVSDYRDWRRLIDSPDVDAVSLCLPHHLHADAALACLAAGKHLLLEKPLAATLEEAQHIAQAAGQSERVAMVEMTHRFFPTLLAGREAVRSGRLGEIYAISDRVIERIDPARCPAWFFERRKSGGGVALTNGVHMLDRVAWLCGQPLHYYHGQAGFTQHLGDVEDTAVMQLATESGAPVQLLASFQRGGGLPLDDELTVYGSEATLRLWAWRGWRIESSDGKVEEHEGFPPEQELLARIRVGMAGALTEFAAAINEGRPARPTPADLLPVHAILDQFYAQTLREVPA